MNKIIIRENTTLTLDDKYLPVVNEVLSRNANLPIKLDENVLYFNDYTVGILKLEDLLIEVKSKNDAISMKSIFEMYSFVSSQNIDYSMETLGFDMEDSFELTSITSYFYEICNALLSQGLTGTFEKEKKYSNIVKGNIVFEEYVSQEVPFRGVKIINEDYTINSLQNQVIKAAIRKLKETEQNENLVVKLNGLLREFDYIHDKEFNYYELEELNQNIETLYSSNKYYPLVLETSIKILMDLKTSYSNGNIKWYSFLVNSNETFEKYVRKLLSVGIEENVTKWKEPKIFTSIKGNNQSGTKSYSPDILIGYNEIKGITRAVLDVKNKEFNPINHNVTDLVSSNDLYQILFYCRRLKTNIGAIIYPTDKSYEPFKIEINDEGNPIVFLISINMQQSFENRLIKLVNEVKEYILSNT